MGKRVILKNASWLLVSRIINIINGIIVSVVVTRYLGVEQKGILANIAAISSFFSFIAVFGLGDILIKEYAEKKNMSKTIATSAGAIMLVGGGLSFVLGVGFATVLKSSEYVLLMVGVSSSVYFFEFLKVFEYWFYSQSDSKLYTIGQFIVHTIFLGNRLWGVALKASITWFVICNAGESICTLFVLLPCYLFSKNKLQGKRQVDIVVIKHLIKLCVPILISGFATSIYMKIDQIMVGKMMTEKDLGEYAVAVSLAEYWYFIPGIIYMSFLPLLSSAKKNMESFQRKLQGFADFMLLISYVAVLGVFLLGDFGINLLYGSEFAESASILKVYIWSGVFTAVSYVGQAYFVVYENTKYLMTIQLFGALLNFILNLLLIPVLGKYGAALATLVQYIIICAAQMLIFRKKHNILFGVELKSFVPFKRVVLMVYESKK